MMELEASGMSESESFKGIIDESVIPSPPGSKISSGYGSDDDHIYCVNSRAPSHDTTPAEPLSLNSSPPQSPVVCPDLLTTGVTSAEDTMELLALPSRQPNVSDSGGRCTAHLDDLQDLMNLLESSDVCGDSSNTLAGWPAPDESMEVDPPACAADPKILLGLLTEARKSMLFSQQERHDQQLVPPGGEGLLLSPSSAELSPDAGSSQDFQSPTRVTSPPAGEGVPISLALLQDQSSPQMARSASPQAPQAQATFPTCSLDSDGNMVQGFDDMLPRGLSPGESPELTRSASSSCLTPGMSELSTSSPLVGLGDRSDTLAFGFEGSLSSCSSSSAPLVGSNPFLLDSQAAASSPLLLVTSSAILTSASSSTSSSISSIQPTAMPTLSTPTTMYIPTTSGMSSVKLPQTPLNKTSSISLLTAKRPLNGSSSNSRGVKPLAIRLPPAQSSHPSPHSAPPHNPCPRASSLAFRNDHPYTSKQPDQRPHHHHHHHHHHGQRSRGVRHSSSSSVLETLLTTTKQLNPNEGSEKVLAAEGLLLPRGGCAPGGRATPMEDDSEDGEEAMAPLLKKLLTGEMNQVEVHRNEQQVIDDRKVSLDALTADPFELDISVDTLAGLDDADAGIDLGLLGAETGSHGNRIWTPSSPRHDVSSLI